MAKKPRKQDLEVVPAVEVVAPEPVVQPEPEVVEETPVAATPSIRIENRMTQSVALNLFDANGVERHVLIKSRAVVVWPTTHSGAGPDLAAKLARRLISVRGK
jgi:hypothetical protein